MDEEALGRLADAVYGACNPRAVALERLRVAVNGIFENAERDRPGQARHLELADAVARHRELRARMESRYDMPAMYDRLAARGGMSAFWC